MRVVLEAELSAADAKAYDAFVDDAPGGHFSQTRVWSPLATAGRARDSAYFLACEGRDVLAAAHVLRPKLGPIPGPVAILERGPVCRSPDDLSRVLPALLRVLRRRGVLRTTVMPYFANAECVRAENHLASAGFRNVQAPGGAHVRTLRFDLKDKASDALFGGGEREGLRRKLKQAEKAGVRARLGDAGDVRHLERLHRQMMSAQAKASKPAAYFARMATLLTQNDRGALFVAEHTGEIVAALFVMTHASLVTFVAGATTPAPRQFSKMALAMAAAITWAHARGAEAFDLGGIPAREDGDPKRAAIAQFKFDFTKHAIDLTAEHARWF